MNWFTNNLNWLIYVFVLVIPVVSSVGKWLQQEAAKKKAEAEKRRRAEAQLRTGRADPSQPTPTAPSPAQAPPRPAGEQDRPDNFAERRRRQIEELKRRQEAAQRQRETAQQSPSKPVPPPVAVPGSNRTSAPAPAPRPQRRRTPETAGPTMRATPEQPSAEIESLAKKFERQAAAADRSSRTARVTDPAIRIGPGLDRQTLRQAVVLSEVLAPPVGMRDDAQRAV